MNLGMASERRVRYNVTSSLIGWTQTQIVPTSRESYVMFMESILVATKQLYVNASVRLSACHTLFTMFPSSYDNGIFSSYHQRQK